jgi:hypothetical protein
MPVSPAAAELEGTAPALAPSYLTISNDGTRAADIQNGTIEVTMAALITSLTASAGVYALAYVTSRRPQPPGTGKEETPR